MMWIPLLWPLLTPQPIESLPRPSEWSATAYCKGHTVAAGLPVKRGMAASDPKVLPLGSVVKVTSSMDTFNGIYTVVDTGPAIQGKILDLYVWSCYEALAFGRRIIDIEVLRHGWHPSGGTTP